MSTPPNDAVLAAREQLVQALADGQVADFSGDSSGWARLAERMREGFDGYDSMSVPDLVLRAREDGILPGDDGSGIGE